MNTLRVCILLVSDFMDHVQTYVNVEVKDIFFHFENNFETVMLFCSYMVLSCGMVADLCRVVLRQAKYEDTIE